MSSYEVIEYKEDPQDRNRDEHNIIPSWDEYQVVEKESVPDVGCGNAKKIELQFRNFRQQQQQSSSLLLETSKNFNSAPLPVNDSSSQVFLLSFITTIINKVKRVLSDLFLPIDFPHSVEGSYLKYQFYDSLQGLCSYLRGVVSTSAVLTAAGVGNADATALSAAMTWAMKDGLGMIGGLTFSYYASPQYDAYVKEFRLFADLVNDVGLTLDMLAPYFSNNLLLISSFSTLCKTMCGMSAGATKSSITLFFARDGNMADLNAKEGTQETLVSLLGMILGVQLAKQLQSFQEQDEGEIGGENTTTFSTRTTEYVAWTCFILLTLIHIWANVLGVQLLKLRSLNRERLSVALDNFLEKLSLSLTMADGHEFKRRGASLPLLNNDENFILSPNDIKESLLRSTGYMLFSRWGRIQLGVPLKTSLRDCTDLRLLKLFEHENYVLNVNSRGKIMVTLRAGADPHKDELRAFVHALLLDKCYQKIMKRKENDNSTAASSTINNIQNRIDLIERTYEQVNFLCGDNADEKDEDENEDEKESEKNSLLSRLEFKGWDVHGRLYLGFTRRRAMWNNKVKTT